MKIKSLPQASLELVEVLVRAQSTRTCSTGLKDFPENIGPFRRSAPDFPIPATWHVPHKRGETPILVPNHHRQDCCSLRHERSVLDVSYSRRSQPGLSSPLDRLQRADRFIWSSDRLPAHTGPEHALRSSLGGEGIEKVTRRRRSRVRPHRVHLISLPPLSALHCAGGPDKLAAPLSSM